MPYDDGSLFDEYGSMGHPHPNTTRRSDGAQGRDTTGHARYPHDTYKEEADYPRTERGEDRQPSTVHRDPPVQERAVSGDRFGFHRGCEWGLCCVYSMWYDPRYRCPLRCTHVCRFKRRKRDEFRVCGPSLLEDSVPARAFDEYRRRNERRTDAKRNANDQTFHHRPQRRAWWGLPNARAPDQTIDPPHATETVPCLPRAHYCVHAVRKASKCTKRNRDTARTSAVSRIRTRMGSRAKRRSS